jgi:RNA-directed DNA polymerase
MRAAFSLEAKDYETRPMRLVIIRQKGSEKDRHIQIPTFFDRAMQTLYAYSLDPVAETTGDRKSFAFRRGRSMWDVHAYIVKALEKPAPPKFIVKADVRACYASISHKWLLANIPMDRYVLRQFLKAGHVFGGELFPSDDTGISLGSSLSPILANMTLDGAQQAIFDGLHGNAASIEYSDGNLIRFADDMLITANTRESAERVLEVLRAFLAIRGLALSDEKTAIVSTADGFDFMSRHYEYKNGFVYATPSKDAVEKMEREMGALISPYRGGQKALIEKLNRKLSGWANYHKITEAADAFRHLDSVVKTLLLELCEKLSSKSMTREKIIRKYFYRESDGSHVYAMVNKPDVRVRRLADTVLVHHRPVSTKMNPYLDEDYYEERTEERSIMTVTGKYKPIWLRQGGKCHYCGKPILKDEVKAVEYADQAHGGGLRDLAYVHDYCRAGQAEFYDCDLTVDSRADIAGLLARMSEGKLPRLNKKYMFAPLTEHIRLKHDSVFTLTFDEIDGIIDKPLCHSARNYIEWWYRRGEYKISSCWLTNGYRIRNLDLVKHKVVLERIEEAGEAVSIPEVFLSGRVPKDAKVELETLFEHIRKKYGLK